MNREFLFPTTVLIVLGENTITVVGDYGSDKKPLTRRERAVLVDSMYQSCAEFGVDVKIMTEEEMDEPQSN